MKIVQILLKNLYKSIKTISYKKVKRLLSLLVPRCLF